MSKRKGMKTRTAAKREATESRFKRTCRCKDHEENPSKLVDLHVIQDLTDQSSQQELTLQVNDDLPHHVSLDGPTLHVKQDLADQNSQLGLT